jgi:virginiamycin B lyase
VKPVRRRTALAALAAISLAACSIGPDGNVWITGSSVGSIEKLSADGKFIVYPILDTEPVGISSGSDGELWFAEENAGAIGKITTSGHVTSFPIPVRPSQSSQPAWTALGPDGRTWFVDQGLTIVGAVTSAGVTPNIRCAKDPFRTR